jgi:hypothetical protein
VEAYCRLLETGEREEAEWNCIVCLQLAVRTQMSGIGSHSCDIVQYDGSAVQRYWM